MLKALISAAAVVAAATCVVLCSSVATVYIQFVHFPWIT